MFYWSNYKLSIKTYLKLKQLSWNKALMGVTLKFTYPVKVFKRFNIVMFIGIYAYGQIDNQRYTNADLKISLQVRLQIKIIPWKFYILSPKNSRVIRP